MGIIRVHSVVASSHPLEAYGGIQLSEEVIRELAAATGRGEVPMNIGHNLARPLRVSNVTSNTDRSDDGYLQALIAFDVEEELWEPYQRELRAAGISGMGAMSITFMEPLGGEGELTNAPVVVAGDAHHFTDEEIRAAAVILRSLDRTAAGQRMFQLSADPELRVVFGLVLEFVTSVGAGLVTSAIYDAAKTLFRPGKVNTFDLSFKQAKNGKRSLKASIKVSTEEELKTALDRLPAVLESGARGTFDHQNSGYVRVDHVSETTLETENESAEIESSGGSRDEGQSSPPVDD